MGQISRGDMQDYFSLAEFDEAAHAIRSRTDHQPTIGIILGSGLGELAENVQKVDLIPFNVLPHWPVSLMSYPIGQCQLCLDI